MREETAVHIEHGRTPEQKEVMRRIQEEGVDPFDWDLLHNYHEKPVLRKTYYWLVTENDYPYEGTAHHFLLIYRDRVRHVREVSQDAFGELHSLLSWLESAYHLNHGAMLMRFGSMGHSGGSVDHLHVHVIVGGTDTCTEKLKATVGYKK